jgi:hypothetical protein
VLRDVEHARRLSAEDAIRQARETMDAGGTAGVWGGVVSRRRHLSDDSVWPVNREEAGNLCYHGRGDAGLEPATSALSRRIWGGSRRKERVGKARKSLHVIPFRADVCCRAFPSVTARGVGPVLAKASLDKRPAERLKLLAIYLDTNVMYRWLTLAEFDRLALTILATELGQDVVVPSLVADELEGHRRRQLVVPVSGCLCPKRPARSTPV